MMLRRSVGLIVLTQLVLLGIESLSHYDTGVRQAALALTNIVATAGVVWLDTFLRRRGAGLSFVSILMVAAAVWLDALGNFQHLYGGFWWWDRVTHASGGLAVSALFMDVALARRKIGGLGVSSTSTLWFGYLLGQFVAAMYEVSEWLGDWWFQTERVRGPYDTPRDLFFNAFGGIIILLIMRQVIQGKKGRQSEVVKPGQKML